MSGNKKQFDTINRRYGRKFWSEQGRKGGEAKQAGGSSNYFDNPSAATRAIRHRWALVARRKVIRKYLGTIQIKVD